MFDEGLGDETVAQCVVIVDDEPTNVELLKAILRQVRTARVVSTTDSTQALDLIRANHADLLLLDLMMPKVDGYQIMEALRLERGAEDYLPVLVLTADAGREALHRSLAAGATDFLTKPFDPTEALLRITNLLRTRELHVELAVQNAQLDSRVRQRTAQLEQAKLEILDRLARATEYRDGWTGEHTRRVGANAGLLWQALGQPVDDALVVELAAPLHDVGKVGIPDNILLKPGPLTEAEFEIVKNHSRIGAAILSGSEWEVLQMAEVIALRHHEHWDGTGYPDGLQRDEIPIEARIVLVCDVFDALVSSRPYKEAWDVGDAVEEIRRLAGTVSDPAVVDAFCRLHEEGLIHL